MIRISRIRVRVIIYEDEDYSFIKEKISKFFDGIDKKDIIIDENIGRGLYNYNIIVINYEIYKKKDIDKFFENLLKLGLNHNEMIENINFDENSNVYLRINRKDFLYRNEINTKYIGDAIHIKISIDGHKKNNEAVKKFLMEYLDSLNKKFKI